MNSKFDFVIIGAGLAGLTCAHELTKKGFSVLVLEKEPVAGGRVKTVSLLDGKCDVGAQFFSHSYRLIPKLINELNLNSEVTLASPDMGFLRPEGLITLKTRNPLSAWSSGLLPFKSYVTLMKKALSLKATLNKINFEDITALKNFDNYNARDFCLNELDPKILKNFFEPFFSSFNYCKPNEISEAMVIRTLGHLTEGKRLFGFKHGLITLIEGLSRNLNIKYSVRVNKIINNGDHHQIYTNIGFFSAKKLILATTASVARELMRDLNSSEHADVLNVSYSSCSQDSLSFRRRPIKNEMNNIYGLMISREESEAINVITLERLKSSAMTTPDVEIMSVLSSAEGFKLSESGQDLLDESLRLIEKVLPYRKNDLLERQTTTWVEAIPRCPPGRAQLIARYRLTRSAQDDVFLAGDYLGTPCAEGAVESGSFIASLFTAKSPIQLV